MDSRGAVIIPKQRLYGYTGILLQDSDIQRVCSQIQTLEHSQTLSALFQPAIEVALEDCCQWKDRTSPRGSGV